MAEAIQPSEANHYVWGEVCDGWHLVKQEGLSVIEERMPPGAAEQRHLHHRARQFFYVLAGEFTMELEGHLHRLTAGQGLEIVPGAAHQARNESSADVRFLVVSSPPSHGDREPAPASNSFLPERCAAGDEGAAQRPGIDVSL